MHVGALLFDAAAQSRLRGKECLDLALPIRCEAAIDEGLDIVIADRTRARHHFSLRNGVTLLPSSSVRRRSRARLRRDITVPIGTSVTLATSS